jgi:hypothetical protein
MEKLVYIVKSTSTYANGWQESFTDAYVAADFADAANQAEKVAMGYSGDHGLPTSTVEELVCELASWPETLLEYLQITLGKDD